MRRDSKRSVSIARDLRAEMHELAARANWYWAQGLTAWRDRQAPGRGRGTPGTRPAAARISPSPQNSRVRTGKVGE